MIAGILDKGIHGYGGLISSEKLALGYKKKAASASNDDIVESMIKKESVKNFSTGFFTGLGGIITLPAAVPASLYSSWVIQARLAAAIALIYGYSPDDEKVKTFILISVIGSAGKRILKNFGLEAAGGFASLLVKKIPEKILNEINKAIGFRLVTMAGEKGSLSFSKIIPLAGGFAGGIIDTISCFIVGRTAKKIFGKEGGVLPSERYIYNINFSSSQLSRIISGTSNYVEGIEIPDDNIFRIKFRHLPFSLILRYAGIDNSIITLKIEGNPISGIIFSRLINAYLKKLPEQISRNVSSNKKNLIVDINNLMYGYKIKGLQLKEFVVLSGEIKMQFK